VRSGYFPLRTAQGRLLFLGLSESVDEGARLFAPLDKKHRLYTRRTAFSAALSVPSQPTSCGRRYCATSTGPLEFAEKRLQIHPGRRRNPCNLSKRNEPDFGRDSRHRHWNRAWSSLDNFNAFIQGNEGIDVSLEDWVLAWRFRRRPLRPMAARCVPKAREQLSFSDCRCEFVTAGRIPGTDSHTV
jgi:hypothetical protein